MKRRHGAERCRRLRPGLAFCAAIAVGAGCGQAVPPRDAPPTSSVPRLSGEVTVFAAASLTEAFADTRAHLVSANPGLTVTYSFAGSQQLVAQVVAGAPADVVAIADEASMQRLVAAGLVEPPRTFARNTLEIVVAPGNPRGVKRLSDLARSDLRLVLADPSVPVGKYGRQVLDRQGVRVSPLSLELDVKSELAKVEAGEADAAIVYVTDVRSAGARVSGVEVPPDQNVVAAYPAAVVRATRNRALAQAFVDQLLVGVGRDALRVRGFLPPS